MDTLLLKKTKTNWDWAIKYTRFKYEDPDEPSKKKLRGATKKRLASEEKKMFPKGRPMYQKFPAHRQLIFSKDIERFTHYKPRAARQYLSRVRKLLGKKKGDLVTLSEFCDVTPFKKEDIIPYLV